MIKKLLFIAILAGILQSCTFNLNIKEGSRQYPIETKTSSKIVIVITGNGVDVTEGDISQSENCISYTAVYRNRKARKMTCGGYEVMSFDNEKDMKKYLNQ